jgi:hypothetical protein
MPRGLVMIILGRPVIYHFLSESAVCCMCVSRARVACSDEVRVCICLVVVSFQTTWMLDDLDDSI